MSSETGTGHVIAQPLLDAGARRPSRRARATPLGAVRGRATINRLAEAGTHGYPPETKRRLMILNMIAYLIAVSTLDLRHPARVPGLREVQAGRSHQSGAGAVAVLVPFSHRISDMAGGLIIVTFGVCGAHSLCGLSRPLVRRATAVHRRQRRAVRGVRAETALAHHSDHPLRSRPASGIVVLVSAFIGHHSSRPRGHRLDLHAGGDHHVRAHCGFGLLRVPAGRERQGRDGHASAQHPSRQHRRALEAEPGRGHRRQLSRGLDPVRRHLRLRAAGAPPRRRARPWSC